MALEITPPKRDLPRPGHRRADLRALWRLSGWGGMAALALAALAITTQTDIGGERLQLAFTAPAEPARAVADLPPRPPVKDAETRALEAQVRALAADRDRLAARLASLERHVNDMTGSIQRQAAQPAPAASAPVPAAQIASVAPIPEAPATTAVAASPVPPVIDPLAMPAATGTGASWPDMAQPQQPAPPAAAITETVPLPPTRVAALTASEHTPPPPVAPKHEYGIELATAPDIDLLRARWAAVKANYGPLLAGLQPVAVHDRRPGSSNYRLIAGPLTNFTAAKQMCTRFAAAGAVCRPARFDANSIVQR